MSYIREDLRQLVRDRAKGCCEYCLLAESSISGIHEVDHIVPQKHRGDSVESNLCLCCWRCNRHKGTDLASFDIQTGNFAFLFHPRRDSWAEHFRLNGAIIEPLTPIGRVTDYVLQFNTENRVSEREGLLKMDQYPCR